MKHLLAATTIILLAVHAVHAEWIVNNSLVTNETAEAKTFQIYADETFTLDVSETMIRGSVVVALQDMGVPADGAAFSDNSTPVYKAYIDGVEVETLLDTVTLPTTPPNTVALASEEFTWKTNPGGVNESIAIQIEFTLSPGDSATVQSRFEVIPEPASIALIGLTGSAIAFIRRRFIA